MDVISHDRRVRALLSRVERAGWISFVVLFAVLVAIGSVGIYRMHTFSARQRLDDAMRYSWIFMRDEQLKVTSADQANLREEIIKLRSFALYRAASGPGTPPLYVGYADAPQVPEGGDKFFEVPLVARARDAGGGIGFERTAQGIAMVFAAPNEQRDKLFVYVATLADRTDIVDRLRNIVIGDRAKGTVTLFDGDLSIATTSTKRDGTRATGAKALENAVRRVFESGEAYFGLEEGLEGNELALYDPLRTNDGRVIGMLRLSMDAAQFQNEVVRALLVFWLASFVAGLLIAILFWFGQRVSLGQAGPRVVVPKDSPLTPPDSGVSPTGGTAGGSAPAT